MRYLLPNTAGRWSAASLRAGRPAAPSISGTGRGPRLAPEPHAGVRPLFTPVRWTSTRAEPGPRVVRVRVTRGIALTFAGLVTGAALTGCGSSAPTPRWAAGTPTGTGSAPAAALTPPGPSASPSPSGAPAPPLPPAGNPNGHAAVPADGQPADTSHPSRVIGTGTPESCTSDAVVIAVAAGGVRVHLSGGGQRRILYQNTCDKAQGWTTSHCQDQDTPQLTVQNLTFADGNSTGDRTEGGGGGAIFVRGGRLKVVNSRFLRNRCDPTGPDLGGAAIRALSQSRGLPVYVVSSTFSGGVCSNGAGLSSIGVSWVVLNSVFGNNSAIGSGANPARGGTPGGGSGGAIYLDGDLFTLRLAGTVIENNHAKEGGGAVFFVSNNRTGTMSIEGSTLRHNPSDGFETRGFPGIFFLGARNPTVTGSTLG